MIVNGQQYECQGVALAMWVTMVTHCWHWKESLFLRTLLPVTGLVRLTGDCVDGVGQSGGDLLCQICSSHLTLSSLTTLSIN